MAHAASDAHKKGKKRKQYGEALKKTELALAHWQQALEQESQRNLELNEHTWVLSEYLYVQDQIKAIYNKHQHWLRTGGPQGAQHMQQQHQSAPALHDNDSQLHRPHWVLHLLESATFEQLQQALSMDCSQWIAYHNRYCSELLQLSEISKRCPELQRELLAGAGLSVPLKHVPTAYSSSSHTGSPCDSGDAAAAHSGEAAAADSQNQVATLAWDVIVEKVTSSGILSYLSLLHGQTGLFEASSKNMLTGEEAQAPLQHWLTVARRMQFSRQQKLHFKLALEMFRRQARAAAAKGVTCLHQAPSYAFILACEMISAEQEARDASTDCPMPDAATAVPAADCRSAGADGTTGTGAATERHTTPNTAAAPGTAAGPSSSTAGQPSAPTRSTTPAAAHTGSGSGSSSMSVPTSAASGDGGGDEDGTWQPADVEDVLPVDEELKRAFRRYFQDLVNMSIFLADTLTVKQAFILNLASFPFYPLLPAIAELAVGLPDSTASEEQPEVRMLMSHRRAFMQQVNQQWWSQGNVAELAGGFKPGAL